MKQIDFNRHAIAAATATLAIGLGAGLASAQDEHRAIASGDYGSASTWDLGVPDETDDAFVNGGYTVTVSDSQAAFRLRVGNNPAGETGTVVIESGGTLSTDRVVTLGGFPTSTGFGTMVINGGTLDIGVFTPGAGAENLVIGDAAGDGSLTLNSGQINTSAIFMGVNSAATGTVTQFDGSVDARADITIGENGTGIYTLSGGSLFGDGTLFVGRRPDATGTFTQTGGSVAIASNAFIANASRASGTYSLSGDASASIGGTLSLGGAVDGANAVAEDNAGTLELVGDSVLFNIGGDLLANAGDSASGTDNASILAFTLDSISGLASIINVVGLADLDGATLDVDLNGATPAGPVTLLEASSISADGFMIAASDEGDYIYDIVGIAGGRQALQISVTAIPEPAAATLGGLSVMLLSLRRRRC